MAAKNINKAKSRLLDKFSRVEEDEVKFISGVFNDFTTGAPLTVVIENKNVNSKDYPKMFRPSHADLTAYENIKMQYDVLGINNYDGINELLKLVGLEEKIHAYPSQLSGGEQQRVAIARAIAKNPKLLLCDEPTGALDYNTGKQILKLLQETCRKEKITVIIITHNTAITPIANKIISIKNGTAEKILINDNPKSIDEIEW